MQHTISIQIIVSGVIETVVILLHYWFDALVDVCHFLPISEGFMNYDNKYVQIVEII